jgi:hypothetical protein
MSKNQKYYRTIITVEILSDYPYSVNTLADVEYDMTEGDVSGKISQMCEEISKDEIKKALIDQGSDPAFILCEDWEDNEAN